MKLIDRMVSEFHITRKEARAAIRAFEKERDAYYESYRGHISHSIVKGLEAAAKILDEAGFRTYGVEGNCGQSFEGGEYRNPPSMFDSIVDYLNRGDTYAVTLAYDYRYRGGCLRVTTWGDIIERCDRDFGRVYK